MPFFGYDNTKIYILESTSTDDTGPMYQCEPDLNAPLDSSIKSKPVHITDIPNNSLIREFWKGAFASLHHVSMNLNDIDKKYDAVWRNNDPTHVMWTQP